MVTIPADAAGNMQQYIVQIEQCAGNFVGNDFGRVDVTSIQTEQDVAADSIAHVKFM